MRIPDHRLAIERAVESNSHYSLPREYLGMSEIGHSCPRYLWYTFRWCYNMLISARQQRIFDRGDLEEERILKDLRHCNIRIGDTQREMVGAFGHLRGHCDGVAIGIMDAPKTPHLLELKSMASKYFTILQKDGIKKAQPVYWAQAQMYMGYLGLTRALFIVTNKDNEERYYERIRFDQSAFNDLNDKALDIIATDVPPPKIGGPDWYECKWCDARGVCHGGEEPFRTCRTCSKVAMKGEGKWECTKDQKVLGPYAIIVGCQDRQLLSSLE